MKKCKKCGKEIKEVFTEGYSDYCYDCGYKEAQNDFKEFEKRRFEAELTQENPDFSDFDYEDIKDYI